MTTTKDLLTTLSLGIAVGLLGSYSDDLLGSSAVVSVLQVALWILAGALLVGAALSLRGRGERRPQQRGLRPTAS